MNIVAGVAIAIVVALGIAAAVFVLSPTTANLSSASSSLKSSSITTSSGTCSQNGDVTSRSTTAGLFADAVPIYLYLNGTIASGTMNFNLQPGSQSTIKITATYPSISPIQCIQVSFTIGSFPANANKSTIPNWLHVSLSAHSLYIMSGTSSSVDLVMTVDKTTAIQQVGSSVTGAFELQSHYLDPASGNSVTEDTPISITS